MILSLVFFVFDKSVVNIKANDGSLAGGSRLQHRVCHDAESSYQGYYKRLNRFSLQEIFIAAFL